MALAVIKMVIWLLSQCHISCVHENNLIVTWINIIAANSIAYGSVF